MNGYLTIVYVGGGGVFLMVVFQPPQVVFRILLEFRCGQSSDEISCNEVGDKIIHAYVQLLFNNESNIKWRIMQGWKNNRPILDSSPIF